MQARLVELLRQTPLARLQRFVKSNPLWGWGLAGLGCLVVLIAAALSAPSPLPATMPAFTSPAAAAPVETTLDTLRLVIGVVLKLGLVIFLIYASLYLLRRWRGPLLGAPLRQISVLETTRLSPRQAMHLVKVGDRVFLVGAADQGLSMLAELEPRQFCAQKTQDAPLPAQPLPHLDFISLLANQQSRTGDL